MFKGEPVAYLQPVVAFVDERLNTLACFADLLVEVHAATLSDSTSRFSMLTIATVL